PEFKKWLVAMNAEMQSMYDNKVWRLVVLPPNAKVVRSKWIYKKKTDMDGSDDGVTTSIQRSRNSRPPCSIIKINT
nr:zinc finger, CCHC-type [Tanacetum cinerariifolium]